MQAQCVARLDGAWSTGRVNGPLVRWECMDHM